MGTHPIFESDFDCLTEMPLPAALAARLSKRGIKINQEKKDNSEEIFAEDKSISIIDEFGQKLPKNWDKAWDSEYETWYYWNITTLKVSWLNPDDPDAEITEPKNQFGGGGEFGQLRTRVTRDADLRTKKENYEKRRGSDHRASRENNYSSRGSSSNSSR